MATYAVTKCDLCMSDSNVRLLTVSFGKKVWEADLCEKCYGEQLGDLAYKGRRPTKSNIKPPHKFKITELVPENL